MPPCLAPLRRMPLKRRHALLLSEEVILAWGDSLPVLINGARASSRVLTLNRQLTACFPLEERMNTDVFDHDEAHLVGESIQ